MGILSRGEHQRVALFCTLVLERPIVVLDEPFSAFDPLQLRGVLDVVKKAASAGATVIASIHQMADAEKIADRFLLLAEGKAVAFGDLPALRALVKAPEASLEELFVSLLEKVPHAS
jgi:ABC-2 type transport system ATP-binding protein